MRLVATGMVVVIWMMISLMTCSLTVFSAVASVESSSVDVAEYIRAGSVPEDPFILEPWSMFSFHLVFTRPVDCEHSVIFNSANLKKNSLLSLHEFLYRY